ncbi:MAG TPA: DUF523 domain-containing protein [Eubacteriaceae bacterium]|nr:DUF523 domain-containing protein [Eubacteriaceae bacterium]
MDRRAPILLTKRPVIGISACCFGAPLRYNGKGWNMPKVLGREKNDYTWVPVCPEVMSGLGVPRDPIHIAGTSGEEVWNGDAQVLDRKKRDVTFEVRQGCERGLEVLETSKADAFVYMDGSPTCGVYTTSLKNKRSGKPPGVFGSKLLEKELFLIPALDLQSPVKWWDAKRRLMAYIWLKNETLHTKKEMYEVWYRYKFICQELDEKWAREKGREIANLKGVSEEYGDFFKKDILNLLRKPSKKNRIENSLWKHYSYYKKWAKEPILDIGDLQTRKNATILAKELNKMERSASRENIVFGTAPVYYNPRNIKE